MNLQLSGLSCSTVTVRTVLPQYVRSESDMVVHAAYRTCNSFDSLHSSQASRLESRTEEFKHKNQML
jgi:hypothetical protein